MYIYIYIYIYIYLYIHIPLILKGMTDRHIWKEKENQKPTLFLTKQCWSPRYKVLVLSTSGGCHSEDFIVGSVYNCKCVATNHDNNNNNNDTNNNKLSSCINFDANKFYCPVSIFLYHFSFFVK